MSSKRALYEQLILEHNKKPRNFGELECATCKADGFNALCGDQFTIYLKLDGDVISDVRFDGHGCAISKSAASVMTTVLKGKTRKEAEQLFVKYHEMLTAPPGTNVETEGLGKLAAFSGVREFPVRIKCATLAWHTMMAALENRTDTVSTE